MVKFNCYSRQYLPYPVGFSTDSLLDYQKVKLFPGHYGAIPVDVSGNTPQPEIEGATYVGRPVIVYGSSTYPLDVNVALTKDDKKITTTVVNPTLQQQQIQ